MKPAEGTTMIGKSVVVKGDLSGSEDLFLDGVLEGTVTLGENRLTVGPHARLTADLNVQELVVMGQITGNVVASGRVELRNSAIVVGNILAVRLSVEESAVIRGRVELRSVAGAKAEGVAPVRTVTPVVPVTAVPVSAVASGTATAAPSLETPAVAVKTEPLFKA